MEQKFIQFEDALEMLGISAEKLNELREHGQLRAYRDGSSWKFRGDEIRQMIQEGVPEPPPPSDIGLVDPEELVESSPLELEDDQELELQLADEEETAPAEAAPAVSETSSSESELEDSELELEMEDTDPVSAGSELELDELEDTDVAETSDLSLDKPEEPSDPSDSILLSEEELGVSVSASASTIIGKSELESDEGDLELASDDDVTDEDSDVKLASPSGISDVLSLQSATSGVLDDLTEGSSSGNAAAFEDLEELEIDLAAESSRILAPDELAQVQAAAQQPLVGDDDSDLKLDDDSDLSIDDSNLGSTDVPMLELEASAAVADEGSGSEIDLAGDEDLVLSDSEGSDITLDSGDSGINLAPADSGLALQDIPLDMGGSAILSSLALGDESSDPEISLVASDSKVSEEPLAELQTDEDFQLTPLSEGAAEEEGDSSSQVIALDAEMEDLGAGDAGMLDEVILTEDAGGDVVLSEDYGDQPVDDLGVGTYAAAASVAAEPGYSLLNILSLASCAVLLMLASVMMIDMVRNIWSWGETYTLDSSMLDALLGMLGLG